MRYIAATFLVLVLTALCVPSVAACGGGGPFRIEELENHDVIVYAHVVEVDDRGYNAILQVDRYFKGEGGEYLAVVRYSPALEIAATVRNYDTSCTYSGGGEKWIMGSEGYFALSNNGDGTYDDDASQSYGAPHFFVQNGVVEFYSFDRYKDVGTQSGSLRTNKFESLLLQYGGKEKPVKALQNAYPLKRFLTITTQSGQKYQLNPDRSIILLDPQTAPLAISNDGSHVVFRISDEQLGFQYLSLTPKIDDRFDSGLLILQTGKYALFSPDSNFVAVQEAAQITIYMFDNYEHGGYGQRMRMQVVGTKTGDWSEVATATMFWSADSSTVAYQDKTGIWIWDIFESHEPLLIVKNTLELTLLDLSNSGRYVRYKLADKWLLWDIQTKEIFENAIATPNEANLIYIQPEYPEGTPDVNRKGDRACQAPLSRSCPIMIMGDMSAKIFWYKYNQIGLLSCYEESCFVVSYPLDLAIGNINTYQTRLEQPIPLVSAFDYDLTYDQPVVAVNDYTLEFGLYANWDRDEPSDSVLNVDSVDLSKQLDSPIVKLDWGQPIFYEMPQS